MNRISKMIAWFSAFSPLLMGCYSSAIIYPSGTDKDKVYSSTIEYVFTKDGKKYVFDRAPNIVNHIIVGQVNGSQVSIPASDVVRVGVRETDWLRTTAVVGMVVVVAAIVAYEVTMEQVDHGLWH